MQLNGIDDDGFWRISEALFNEDLKEEIIKFFKDNPNPSDDELHEWAEDNGYSPEAIEELVYELATEHVNSMENEEEDPLEELSEDFEDSIPGGLADDKMPDDFDVSQLLKGIDVEQEHTEDPERALEISMDHLVEIEDYYDKLKKMEEEAK